MEHLSIYICGTTITNCILLIEKSIFPREIAAIARKERRAGVAQKYMRAWAVVLALPKNLKKKLKLKLGDSRRGS